MKTIFSSVKHSYLAKIGILLIAIALIVGTVSCNGGVTPKYDLTMAEDPAAGGTATDLTDESPYEEDTDVSIKAVANAGYDFVSWTAPAGTFADANAATTTFTMPAQDVTVTANFEVEVGPLDHFKWYLADGAESIDEVVYLEDQFCAVNATVGYVMGFGNPAEKVHGEVTTPISNPDHHLTGYEITYEEEPQTWFVEVENQFGTQNLTVYGPFGLAVPTQKVVPGQHEPPVGLDHYLVYEVVDGPSVDVSVSLQDQFDGEPQESGVYEPTYFANPVKKTYGSEVTEILNPEDHLVFYYIDASFSGEVQVVNQFGEQTLDVYTFFGFGALAVPSEKISWEQPLNHFKTYWVDEKMPPIGEVVQLEDQFVTITANVTWAELFANPVEKQAGVEFSELSPIWDPRDHLMFYDIDILEGEEGMWEVTVDNQFGIGQWLKVAGPIMVIVPTEKIPHGPAEDLNHFLVYEVLDWEITPMAGVYLWDQFTPFEPEWNTVEAPMLFAVPAQKTVPGSDPTPIIGDEHLLFYYIGGGLGFWEPIVHNQFFGPEPIPVYQGDGDWLPPFDLLGVPSQKTWWNPWEPL